jgi:hypothetical protein
MFDGDMLITNHLRARHPALGLARMASFSALLVLLAGLAAGCASKNKNLASAGDVRPAPLPPLFLNGPMALLLTNTGGFRAHVVLESGAPPQAMQLAAGELMVQGSKLLFAPSPAAKDKKKPERPNDSAFIWDVVENRGWVLNDPLQGYAPVSSSRQFTNVTTAPAPTGSASEKISGHACQPGEVTVMTADGTPTAFRVWRALDLQGLPLRISCPSTGALLTLTLSKVQMGSVPNDLFLPPSSFTKYDSSEAMMAEIFLRKHNLNRKPTYRPESESGSGMDSRSPTRPY